MKNTFKKFTSIIISIIMVVVSIPFATISASAETTSEMETYVKKNYSAFAGVTIDERTKGIFKDDGTSTDVKISDHARNLLYVYAGNSNGQYYYDSSNSSKSRYGGYESRQNFQTYIYTPITVMMYDGVAAPQVPVCVRNKNTNNQGIFELALADRSDGSNDTPNIFNADLKDFSMPNKWKYKNNIDPFLCWPQTYGTDSHGSPSIGPTATWTIYSEFSNSNKIGLTKNTVYTFANFIQFDSNDNMDNNEVFSKSYDVYWYRLTGSSTGDIHGYSYKENNAKMYVVNYKPIKDMANGHKTFKFNGINGLTQSDISFKLATKYIIDNKDNYSSTSYNNYIKAVYNVLKFDPKSEFTIVDAYDKDINTKVSKTGESIKSLVNEYNDALSNLQCTVTFKNFAGETVSTTDYNVNTESNNVTKPSNTATKFNGKNANDNGATYTTYAWPTIAKVTKNATYIEVATNHNCDPVVKEYTKHNGNVKGYTTYTDKDNSNFTWNVNSDVDWSTYDSAIKIANAMVEQKAKYTADSINTLKNVITSNTLAEDQNTTQEQVDTATSNILTAQEKLELNKFDVSFSYQYDDQSESTQGDITSTPAPINGKYSYGTTVTMTVPDEFINGGVVQKWTLNNEDNTVKYSTGTSTISYVVTDNSTFTAYVTKAPQDPTTSAKVEIKNKNDKVTDIKYVKTEEEYSVTTVDRVITVGDNSMTAPKYPYYKVNGFTIGGEVVKENDKIKYESTKDAQTGEVTTTAKIIRGDEEIPITDTTIKPVYEVDTEATKIIIKNAGENSFTVKVANKETTLEQNGTLECEWDKKVVVHADNAKVWYDGDKIVGYGDTYTFQSNVAVNLRYTTEEKTVDPSTSIESFTYDLYNDKTVAIVGSYILPENATKKEMGVILSTKVSAQDQIIALGKKYVLTKETDQHQFFFTISRTANTSFDMYAVSYVTYELDGEAHTVYSTVSNCHYEGTNK